MLGSAASRGASALGSVQYLISGVDLSVFSLGSERRVCVGVLSGTRCTIRSVLKFASASQAAAASQHTYTKPHTKKTHHKNTRPSTASPATATRRRSFRSEGNPPERPRLVGARASFTIWPRLTCVWGGGERRGTQCLQRGISPRRRRGIPALSKKKASGDSERQHSS